MKTILITFLLIGFAQVTYSQSEIAYTKSADRPLSATKSKKHINLHLKAHLEASFMAEKTKRLQLEVLNYDIKNSSVYSAKAKTTYTVNFTEGNHHIEAIYDNKGKLLQSEGVFENVRIPYKLGSQLAKEYPGWEFHKSWYYSSYEHNKNTAILYRIQLKKSHKTKTIDIDPTDYNL